MCGRMLYRNAQCSGGTHSPVLGFDVALRVGVGTFRHKTLGHRLLIVERRNVQGSRVLLKYTKRASEGMGILGKWACTDKAWKG
jgi:hypothetical protein